MGNKAAGRPAGGQGRKDEPRVDGTAPPAPARPAGADPLGLVMLDVERLRRDLTTEQGEREKVHSTATLALASSQRVSKLVTEQGKRVSELAELVAQRLVAPAVPPAAGGKPAKRVPGRPVEREVLAEEAAAPEESDPPLSWYDVTSPRHAQLILTTLVEWVERVYLQNPKAKLSACWLWHDVAIDELYALYLAYCEAHDPETGSGVKACDWRTRYRKETIERVNDEIGTCTLERHRPGGDRADRVVEVLGTDQLVELADWHSRGRPTPQPEPTPDMVAAEKGARTRTYTD